MIAAIVSRPLHPNLTTAYNVSIHCAPLPGAFTATPQFSNGNRVYSEIWDLEYYPRSTAAMTRPQEMHP